MKTLGIIFSARMEDKVFNADDISVRYYISSAELTAEEFSHAAREHWAIENKLHWKMDVVVMREDDCRIRRGNAAEMLTGF
ncbi:ISAs1 family transposase [Endozoicomonas sp. 8E]|uniref:ISAs1 family transposase n=1 Tax=Endozoicomonas sp. 8E TaxID=3035692 RepID=UPI0029392E64|nr:ISAs1 family transposase [Endozoicomonas sp. 8E]WOG29985.1 ISAs1 family transposase [Endozoicomonas sp. 8E]